MSEEVLAEVSNRNTVRDICETFILDENTLKKIKNLFQNEINLGLCKTTHLKSDVKCLITYIQSFSTGCEAGKFLALDMSGGVNIRILCLHLEQDKILKIESEVYEISKNLLDGPGQDLFDHIADCLAKFLEIIEAAENENLPLCITFSFPYRPNDIDKGILVAWSKDFNCSGVVGKDVVEILRQAIERKQITNVNVAALVNVSTGSLISCHWDNPYCKIAVVVGNEINCSYLEKIKYISTFKPEPNNRVPTMIINCECGSFGDNGSLEFIRTKYDIEIDNASQNRECQLFEKMVAGSYLGELARKLMLECCKAGVLFSGEQSKQLVTENSFQLSHLSKVEEDFPGGYNLTSTVLGEMGYKNPTNGDAENVRFICECVSRRSAGLVSAILSCLLDHIGDPHTIIGIEGCVYQQHPYYHNLLKEKIKCLARPDYKFDIALAVDGTGRGAAMIAAIQSCLKSKDLKKDRSRRMCNILNKQL